MITRTNIGELTAQTLQLIYDYNIDWTIEPTESLKELYKQHAEHIRDSYDYVILYFSGGSDSTTMVNAFLDNNIAVDEIVTAIFEDVDVPCFDGIHAANYLKTKQFTGKYTQVHMPFSKIESSVKSDNFIDTWSKNFTGALHSFSRMSIDQYEQFQFLPTKQRLGKVAHVFGIDAPIVIKLQDNYYISHNLKPHILFDGDMYSENTIKFFSSKDFPKVYVKQAHIIAKVMKELNVTTLSLDVINKIIRDTYDPIISPPKSNVLSLLYAPNKMTEATLLYKSYVAGKPTFKDTYLNSVLYQQIKIENNINKLTSQTMKYDLLF